MKLWILRPADGVAKNDNPWAPWYDKAFGFVVRAETEAQARSLAHEEAGDENHPEFMGRSTADTRQPWLDAKYSTCVELTAEGSAEVVMQDFRSA